MKKPPHDLRSASETMAYARGLTSPTDHYAVEMKKRDVEKANAWFIRQVKEAKRLTKESKNK
jgi:hypothetical protein